MFGTVVWYRGTGLVYQFHRNWYTNPVPLYQTTVPNTSPVPLYQTTVPNTSHVSLYQTNASATMVFNVFLRLRSVIWHRYLPAQKLLKPWMKR